MLVVTNLMAELVHQTISNEEVGLDSNGQLLVEKQPTKKTQAQQVAPAR